MKHVSMPAELVILNQCTNQDLFNMFKLNGLSHPYQLDESISSLQDVGWYISIILKSYMY